MNTVPQLSTSTGDQMDNSLPKQGEAVVIIARDGSARFLTIGMSPDRVLEKMRSEEALTEEEEIDLVVSGKAFALALAANTDSIMAILNDIASNPEIVSPATLAGLGAGKIN